MCAQSGWLRFFFLALLVMSPQPSALAQIVREHDPASIRGFHGLGVRVRRSVAPDDEARNFLRQLLDAAGFPPIDDRIQIRASNDTGDAEAFVERGQRYILYNPAFMRELARSTGNYWSLVAVLAHEIGHLLLFHVEYEGRDHDFELEADRQAGFILRRMGATLAEAQSVFHQTSDTGSLTHPGRARRIQSIALGWQSGAAPGSDAAPPGGRMASGAPVSGGSAVGGCRDGWARRVDGVCSPIDPTDEFPRAMGHLPLTWREEASLKPKDRFKECDDCPEVVVLAAGALDEARLSTGRISINRRIAVGRYEVTFAQWDACRADGGCKHNPDDKAWGRGNLPVIHVSWNDIKTQFLPWLSRKTQKRYRLPTEAEWQYAAAAGGRGLFTWGDDIVRGQANCAACGGPWDNRQTAPVGWFGPNAFGLYDVHGNVWEWVEDCVEFNARIPVDGSAATGPPSCWRGLRGGAWDTAQGDLHLSGRGRNWPELRSHTVGFRVVRSLD